MIGFRIFELSDDARISAAWVETFRHLPVANVSDVMTRLSAGGPRLRPMHASGVLVGPAFTVKTRPGDNLMVHKALHMARPGDVMVVDAGGDLTNAIVGEIMTSTAQQLGLAGIVINGAIRDVGAIGQGRLPVYAAGVTHRGPYKDGPGEINVAISLDGMVINPGDLMLGDADGLLCIARDEVATVYAAAQAKYQAEEKVLAEIDRGVPVDTAWIDETLARLQCEFVK